MAFKPPANVTIEPSFGSSTTRPPRAREFKLEEAKEEDEAFINSVIASFKADSDTLQVLIGLYAYDGFDPVSFKKKFIVHLRTLFGTAEKVRVFLLKVLLFGVMRGTKLRDDSKVKEAAKEDLNSFRAAGIDLNPPAGAQKSDKITVQRIMAAFPVEVSLLLGTGKTRVVGDAPNNLPRSFRHANAPSLFPREFLEGEMMVAWRQWQQNFTAVITSNLDTTRRSAVMSRQAQFESIIASSPLYTEEDRWTAVTGILNKEGGGAEIWLK